MNAGVINPSTDRSRPSGRPSPAKSWLKAIELTSRIEADPRRLFADLVEDWAKRQPDRPALISEAETFSYRALAERINRYARWALSAGIEAGDTVCLVMPSRPDYLAAWLGITRVGGVVALINTRLVGLSLAHLRQCCRCRPCHPCERSCRCIRSGAAGFEPRAENLDPWQAAATKRVSTPRWIERMEARCRLPSGAGSPSTIVRC